MANFDLGEIESDSIKTKKSGSAINEYVKNLFDPSLTWNILNWVTKTTKLPVILKGVLTKETALKALEYNVSGIVVSNHGGRQLDCVTSTVSFNL